MDIKEDQLQWFTGFWIKKASGIDVNLNQHANELHKPMKFIWSVDLVQQSY